MKQFIVLFFALFAIQGFAETQYSVSGDYRTYPKGLNLGADINFTQLTMGEKKEPTDWFYGFYRLGAKAFVHGQAEVYADFFPVSILQLGVSRSITSRFYDSDQIDCTVVTCRENLSRATMKANLVLGYGQIFSVIGGGVTQLSLSKADVIYGIEGEAMLAGQNADTLSYQQLFIGYKKESAVFGLYNRAAHVQKTAQDNLASYFVFRDKIDENLGYGFGLGTFKSDLADQQFSAFAGMSWAAGETLSLF